MKPCLNPQVCGVQSHRQGTICKAANPSSGIGAPTSIGGAPKKTHEFNHLQALVWEYGLHEGRHSDKEILSIAEHNNVDVSDLKDQIAETRENEARKIDAARQRHYSRVKEVIAQTPAKIRRGSMIVIDIRGEHRIVKVEVARGGNFLGNTVDDPWLYEQYYCEDLTENSVIRE